MVLKGLNPAIVHLDPLKNSSKVPLKHIIICL